MYGRRDAVDELERRPALMKLKLQLIIESDSGETEVVQEVTKLERHSLRPEDLGLMLSEAKELLQEVQRTMVTYQTTGYVTQQIPCPKCGKIQSRKGKHQIVLRLLAEVLPTGGDINVAGVYRNLQRVAERMEAELGEEKWQFIDGCQREWDRLPPPGPPLIVGLDGRFIHAKDQKSRAWRQGRRRCADRAPRCGRVIFSRLDAGRRIYPQRKRKARQARAGVGQCEEPSSRHARRQSRSSRRCADGLGVWLGRRALYGDLSRGGGRAYCR